MNKENIGWGMHVYNFVNNSIELLRKYVIAMYSHDFKTLSFIFSSFDFW